MTFVEKWMELTVIMSTKTSQIQRKNTGFLSYVGGRGEGKGAEVESQ